MSLCQPKQVGCIAGEDVKLAGKERTKEDKEDAEDNLVDQSSQKRKRGATVTGVEFNDGVEEEDNLNDPDEIQSGGKKTMRGNSGKIILETQRIGQLCCTVVGSISNPIFLEFPDSSLVLEEMWRLE